MKKIVSNKNITIIIDGKPHMIMCGEHNNNYLFTYLNACETEEEARQILENPAYQTYIKTYNDFPSKGETIFEHGHKISYLATNEKYRIKVKQDNGGFKDELPIAINKVKDIAILCASPTKDEAIQNFEDNNYDDESPQKMIKFCQHCKTVHSIVDLYDETQQILYLNEEIINV